MKNPNEWFLEFWRNACTEGRAFDDQICRTFYENAKGRENPQRSLSGLRRARDMAEQTGNRRLVLLIDHWRAQCMINWMRNHNNVLEVIVPAVVEARQPQFSDLPQRFCLQEDLVNAYLSIDPVGNREAIEEAMAYFDREVPRDLDCRRCYLHLRIDFALAEGNVDDAWNMGLEALSEIQSDPGNHHLMICYSNLCTVAARRFDWDALLDNAIAGQTHAEVDGDTDRLTTFRIWQAAALKALGQDADAKRQFTTARRKRVSDAPPSDYYDAVCTYHELNRRPHFAWKARETELSQITDQGRHWNVCECRLKRCRLAKQMNKPDLLQSEVEALHEDAAHLKHPHVVTKQLDAIIDEVT